MPNTDVRDREESKVRPPCYHCGEPYTSVHADRHTEPVSCDVCPRCKMEPACYTCRNMYCPCEIHQHGKSQSGD
jgi:hypothetical protein